MEGKAKIDGRAYYRLRLAPNDRRSKYRIQMSPKALLIDVETGLLNKVIFEYKTCHYDDYRKVDGILVPFRKRVDVEFADIKQHHKVVIKSIKLNIKIDKRQFVPPIDSPADDK